MKLVVMGFIISLMTTSLFAKTKASHLKLTELAASRNVVVEVNSTISSTGYSSRQIEKSSGYWLIPGHKYTYRLTFSFEREKGSWSKFLPLKKGTTLKIEDIKDGKGGFGFESSIYIDAKTPLRSHGDGTFAFSSVYLQVLGNRVDSVDRLTLGDIEKTFDGMISFYFEE